MSGATTIDFTAFIASIADPALAPFFVWAPWQLPPRIEALVEHAVAAASPEEYVVADGVAIHRGARVEAGAIFKAPALIGPDCFIGAGAYLRGGCWLGPGCSLGPGVELKSSLLVSAVRLAHFNFVGDSIIGHNVNLEAGSVVANYRNERNGGEIRIATASGVVATGVEKFGALIGDGCRIGANAVIAPGALLLPGTRVPRLGLVDQDPDA
ncbi:DapH/DapD/GlmU-related protein [Niveibacterium sp. SC-1]|uniref:DapH/DapD/GlmU-related protein n=1 Tax=Niveibacterium sp. SC-1 TaxID=3135646 RepID=UPI00311E6FFE